MERVTRSLPAATGVAVAALVLIIGVWMLLRDVNPGDCALALQLAGDGDAHDRAHAGPCAGVAVRAALWWDMAFLVVYAAGLALVGWLGARALYEGTARRLATWGAIAAVTAGVADAIENVVLLSVEASGQTDWLWVSQGAALAKWVGFVVAAAVAAVVVLTLVWRLVGSLGSPAPPITTWAGAAAPAPDGGDQPAESGGSPADRARTWIANYAVPARSGEATAGGLGVCLSGGGIRSATFALGATQVLGDRGVLGRADYLAAVSGGSYHAGSHQMLRAQARRQGTSIAVADAFAPGTPEEDHRRRHAKYIADGAGGWAVAVGVVVRNLVVSLALLYAGLLLGARVLGAGYGVLAPWSVPLLGATTPGRHTGWEWPAFGAGTWTAVLLPTVLGVLAWVVSALWRTAGGDPEGDGAAGRGVAAGGRASRWRSRSSALAAAFAALAVATGLVVVVGPLLVHLVRWLPHAPLVSQVSAEGALAGGGLLTAVLTIWNMLARNRRAVAAAGSRARVLLGRAEFALRALLSFLVIAGLALAAVLVFGVELARAVSAHVPADPAASPAAASIAGDPWLVAPLVALVAALLFVDQTRTMSLHPFYKRRLATSFAVERDGDAAAELDYRMPTRLSEFARPAGDGGAGGSGPQLLVCAAANVAGPGLAPPGRRVTPVVFAHDWVGGPRLGYFPTRDLERAVAGRAYGGDVTTLGAVAMSGAAFASAMGRHSGPFNILLALTNTRLGAWLPNPRYHSRVPATAAGTASQRPADASAPPPLEATRRALPRIRRLPYWLREITGAYTETAPFVYLTDGGHYDNLGLLELFRRGCETIYCIDASADTAADALAQAATLAYEELGVRIEVEGFRLVPTPAAGTDDDDPVRRRLLGRLARSAVVTGTYAYPDVGPAAGRRGTLHVAKAVLTPDAPFPVLAHAAAAGSFPSDTTADQWFDAEQFEAYRALGRWVAEQLP